MDLPVTVPLKRPITVDDTTYDSLTFDEPDLGSQIAFAELRETFRPMVSSDEEDGEAEPHPIDAMRVAIFWIARLADVSEEVARKIKGSDVSAVDEVVDAIMGADDPDQDAVGNDKAA